MERKKQKVDRTLEDARLYLRRYKLTKNPKQFARMQNNIRKFRREKNEALLKERQEATND